MKRKGILLLMLCLSNSFCSLLWSQEELLREFDAFIRQEEHTFDSRTRQMNKEFALYLKQQWTAFDTYTNQPQHVDPDTPIAKKAALPTAQLEAEQKETLTQSPSLSPKEATEPSLSEWRTLSFFGQLLQIPYQTTYSIRLSGTDENAVSAAWSRAADVNYSFLLNVLKQYKEKMSLNDWGYMQLVRKSVETIYGEKQGNNILFLATYLLNQSAQSARLGKVNGHLALLLEIKETVYTVPLLSCNGRVFSVFCEQPIDGTIQVSTYTRHFPEASSPISLEMPALPVLKGTLITKNLPHAWMNQTIRIEVNKSLIDFFASIPQTDLKIYAESGTSPQMYTLMDTLNTHVSNLNKVEAASLLLDFVQNTFDYQSDRQQFGQEKAFFPDESFYYPYNDCEDRAILFCRLVQKLLGLKVALVDYPNHIAAAVCFPSDIEGTSYLSGTDKYTLCDPTYVGAAIGECMPQYAGMKGKLIKLQTY